MEKLTEHQFKTLKRLANGYTVKAQTYCCVSGLLDSTSEAEQDINLIFNDILKLREWGLMTDESAIYPKTVEGIQTEDRRDAVVMQISNLGVSMFRRERWEKWVN